MIRTVRHVFPFNSLHFYNLLIIQICCTFAGQNIGFIFLQTIKCMLIFMFFFIVTTYPMLDTLLFIHVLTHYQCGLNKLYFFILWNYDFICLQTSINLTWNNINCRSPIKTISQLSNYEIGFIIYTCSVRSNNQIMWIVQNLGYIFHFKITWNYISAPLRL